MMVREDAVECQNERAGGWGAQFFLAVSASDFGLLRVKQIMVQLVYISSTRQLLSGDEIAEILFKSRRNNSAAGVTGMLLYKGGNVLQVLEGEEENVQRTFAKIEKDPRHFGVVRLYEKEIEKRDFPEWSMAFKDPDAEGATYLEGYNSIMERTSDWNALQASDAHKLVKMFVERM
jgi:hypothetical protein